MCLGDRACQNKGNVDRLLSVLIGRIVGKVTCGKLCNATCSK